MGQVYSAVFSAVAVTAQQDFFEINSPATGSILIHAVFITQSTEVKDAEEEMLNIQIKRGATTSGSGGTTPTARPMNPLVAAFTGSVEVNNTTKATAGTIVTLHVENMNVRAGWSYIPTPECRPMIGPSSRLTVELATTPADSITMSGTIVFEVVG